MSEDMLHRKGIHFWPVYTPPNYAISHRLDTLDPPSAVLASHRDFDFLGLATSEFIDNDHHAAIL